MASLAARTAQTVAPSWSRCVARLWRSVGRKFPSSVLQFRSYSDEGWDSRVPPSPEASSAAAADPLIDKPLSSGQFPPVVPKIGTFGADKPVYDRIAHSPTRFEGFRVYQTLNTVSVPPSPEASSAAADSLVGNPHSGQFPPVVPKIETFGADKLVYDRNAHSPRKFEGLRDYQIVNAVSGRMGQLPTVILKPQLTRTRLTHEESPIGKFMSASSYFAQESCHDSPRQGFVCGEERPIASASANGNISLPSGSTTSEVIAIVKHRQQQGLHINSDIFMEILKRCSKEKDFIAATQVHDCIIRSGTAKDRYLATALLNVYIKCGKLQDARRVFDGLKKSHRNVITWTVIIGEYAKGGCGVEAYRLFLQMKREGFKPDAVTYVSILNASAASAGALVWVKEVHSHALEAGLQSDLRVCNALVLMYAKSGSIREARVVFDRMKKRDVITWNIIIGAYAESGCGLKAYELFLQMKREGFTPNAITYVSILNACAAGAGYLDWVKEVHSHVLDAGLESDLRVGNALVHMYAKCGRICEAQEVFDRLEKRTVITWTIIIGAYAERGCGLKAYELFLQMKREGVQPNAITYMSILNASASAGALDWVKEVHSHALEAGLESDLRVGNALIHMYAKSGSIGHARLVFDRLGKRDVITWSVMIGAYAESGCGLKAYELFLQMRREGFKPNAITYMSILNASASAGALEWVKEVHSHALEAGLESDLRVGNALVQMYAKSGSIRDARAIFDRLKKRDVVSFVIMIGGLAQHGRGHEALELFNKLNADCVKPDGTLFVALLSACSHAGLLVDGCRLFLAMTRDYGIEPTVVHYSCMVDLLGRAGHLEDAKLFIDEMRVEPNAVTWQALLGGCRTYGNVELGELAAQELLKLEPTNASAYVLLSNIYAAAGKWEKASSVRTMMRKRGVRKEPGRSWIEVDNKIHEFVASDTSHPEAKAIYTQLYNLTEKLKAEGYIPDTQLVMWDMDEEDKEVAVCSHSEKLAIAYGLIRIPHGKPVRVFKNLRVCPDCHTAAKFISKVTGREIIARDANRFHHFKEGVCSCGDYW